jgi:hypothetical protein
MQPSGQSRGLRWTLKTTDREFSARSWRLIMLALTVFWLVLFWAIGWRLM